MARTKPPVIEEYDKPRTDLPREERRNKKLTFAPIRRPNIYYNRGGFLIDPPDECEYKKHCEDGSVWTDNAICYRTCKTAKTCQRRKEYLDMTMTERDADFRARGVKLDF